MVEPTRIEDEPEAVANEKGIMPFFDEEKAIAREAEIEAVAIDAFEASESEIKPFAEEENSTEEVQEMHKMSLEKYEDNVNPIETEPALRDDQDLKLTYDGDGNATGYEVEDKPFIWEAADVIGDTFTGAIAGGLYSVDDTAQFFANTSNLFSADPEDEIRVFSYLGDWLMKDGGDAKEFGRDLGHLMVPFLGWFKLAKMATSTVSTLKAFDKAPRFIAGAKGVKNLPKVNKGNIKKEKLQNWLKKDLTSGQLAYLLTGGTAYNADELGGGLAALKALDGHMGGHIGEFFQSDGKTNAQKRLENAFGERFVFHNIDKHLLPIVKQLGLSVHNWTSKPLAAKVAQAVGMEKHILAQKQRVKLNAQGQGSTVITADEKTGLLKISSREDGSIEFITQERVGHGFKQIIRSKEEMSDFALKMVPEGTTVKDGVIAIEHEGILYSAKVGEKVGGRTIYTHLDLVEAHGAGATEIKAGTKTGFLDPEGKFIDSPASMPRQRYETLPELQGDEFIAGANRLDKLKSMWDDGSLKERMDTAPTLMEKVSVANDIIEVLERSAKGSGKSKSIKTMRQEADAILKDMWGDDLMGLMGRAKGTPVNDPIAIAYVTAAKSAHDDLILALQRVDSLQAGSQDAVAATSNMFRTLYNYAGLREQLKDVKKIWGRTGTALRFSQNQFDDLLESPSFAKIMQEAEGATQDDTVRLAIALSTALKQEGGKGLAKAVESFGKSGFTEGFAEGWIGLGLLSNPALQMLNLATGILNVGATIGSRQISGVASKITGHGNVLMGEAMVGVYGMLTSFMTATRLGIKAAVTGKSAPAFTGAKMENYTGLRNITAEKAGLENVTLGLAVDAVGKSARLTNRLLLGGDEFVKVVTYETERSMLAYRLAMTEMKGGAFDYKKFTTRVQEIYNNPTKYKANESGQTIHERSLEQGLLNVLQQNLGRVGKMVQTLQNNVPYISPIVKLHVPFVKVLSNIPKLAVRYSPMSLGNVKGVNSLYKAAPSVRMEEIGRIAYGTMLMYTGSQLYSTGMLTDSGDPDLAVRRTQTEGDVAPPFSLRHVDDKEGKYWVDLSRLQPWINILTSGADIAKMSDTLDEKTIGEHIWKSVWSMKQMLANTSWMPNMHKLLDLMANDKLEPWKFQNTANSLITSMATPAAVRSVAKAYEPMQPEYKTFKTEGENKYEGQPQDYSGIAARMLGISTGREGLVPPHRNYNGKVVQYHETAEAAKKGVTPFGLPHMLTGGALSFMAVREDKSDSVDVEIEQIGLAITKPDDIVNQPQTQIPIRMRYYEYDYYTERIGTIKLNGRTQKQAWKRVIGSKEYQESPIRGYDKTHPSRQDLLMNVHRMFKTAAKEETIARFKIYDRAGRVLDEPPVKYAPESRRKRGMQ
jgi:hypothetical protein